MNHIKPTPRVALQRWLVQIHYNAVRNIETSFPSVMTDRSKPLRGFQIADGLVLTRKRVFYKIAGLKATPMSLEEVSANYHLDDLQFAYREATDAWKNTQRRRSRAS